MAIIKKKPRPDRASRAAQRKALAQTSDPSRPTLHGGGEFAPHYPQAPAPRGYASGDPSAPRVMGGPHRVQEQLPQGGGMMRTAAPDAPRIVDKPRGY